MTDYFLNVKTVGATGDGVTDDWSAIDDAITSALSLGFGTVFFPPGTYLMSRPLAPVSGIDLKGSGMGNTFIRNSGVHGSFGLDIPLFGQSQFQGTNYNDIITYGISQPADGGNIVTTTTAADAGVFSPGSDILITGTLHGTSWWYPSWVTTVVTAESSTGVITLSENIPQGMAENLSLVQLITLLKNVKISDMTIIGGNNAAIQINVAKEITFERIATQIGTSVSGCAFGLVGCRNVTVRDCRIATVLNTLACTGCIIDGNFYDGACHSINGGTQETLLSNNVFTNPKSNGSASNAIQSSSYANRNRFIGNIIANVQVPHAAFNFTGTAGEGDNVIIGNTISGIGSEENRGDAIFINHSKDNIVIGNYINNTNKGIYAHASVSTDQVIVANSILNSQTQYDIGQDATVREPIGPSDWVSKSNSSTPSVRNGHTFKISNSSPTSITTFVDGISGLEIIIEFVDSNTTLVNGGTLKLAGSASYNPPAGTIMKFVSVDGVWRELSRCSQ